jgi:hypothetical protein
MRYSLFWVITQRRSLFTDVSEHFYRYHQLKTGMIVCTETSVITGFRYVTSQKNEDLVLCYCDMMVIPSGTWTVYGRYNLRDCY